MKRFFPIIAAVFCLLNGCSREEHRQLVVGMELKYPPFEMVETNGSPSGVSVDMASALGKYLGRDVKIENIPFDGLIPSLQTHKIDLIISSMTATVERAKTIDFSDPYLKTGLCLLVGKNSPLQSIQDADQAGKTIVVKKGTTGNIYATDEIKNAKVLVLDEEATCVLEVVQAKADGFIYDQISTYENWKRNESMSKPILKPFQLESWAIGLRKGDDELRQQVNNFLKDFKAKGGFDELGDKYLKDQKEAFRKLGYPFYF